MNNYQDSPADETLLKEESSKNFSKSDPDPDDNWLTREESARFLGISLQTLKSYEDHGGLVTKRVIRRDANGRSQVVTAHDVRALRALNARRLAKGKQPEDVTSNWYTRSESADLLRVSTQTIKNYERRGKLHPVLAPRKDSRGTRQLVALYDPKELESLPRGIGSFITKTPGEIQARCFELFEQNKNIREIVIALRETSETIHTFHDTWIDAGRPRLVIFEDAKEKLESVLGPFKDVAALVELVIVLSEKQVSLKSEAPCISEMSAGT